MKYTSSPQQWGELTNDVSISYKTIARIKDKPQWAFIESKIRERHKHISCLRTIEIGAGLGKMSAIMSLMESQTTVLDYSPAAIAKSKQMFDYIGGKAEFMACDALKLPEQYYGKYDVSFSLGAAEHFVGSERNDFIAAHYNVLKPGGISFIVVPNKYSYPYRIGLAMSKMLGRWNILEVPFSKRELAKRATEVGFTNVKVYGFNFSEAMGFMHGTEAIKYLLLKTTVGVYMRKLRNKYHTVINNEDAIADTTYRAKLQNPITTWRTTPWDNAFGYALIMYGRREK